MRAVLISTQPQWVEKIAAKWKSMELRNHSPDFYCGEGERRTDG